MSNALANSYKGAAQATAFSRGMSPERVAERSQAYTDIEKSNQELDMLQATRPTDKDHQTMAEIQTLELQKMQQDQIQMVRDGNMLISNQAFERYDRNGYNVKPINQMLKDLKKRGAKLFSDINRVDNLTTVDIDLMRQAGLNEADIKSILEDPEVNGSYVRITDTNGTQHVRDLDFIKSMTLYNDYADTKELTRQKTTKSIAMMNALGYETGPNTPEALRRTIAELGPQAKPESPEFQEAYTKHFNELRRSRSGRYSSDSKTNERRYAENALATRDIYPGDDGYEEAYLEEVANYKNLKTTSVAKNLASAAEAEDRLVDHPFFDEEKNIKRSDLSRRDRMAIERDVRALEVQGKAALDSDTRKHLKQIKGLAHLGNKASKLTDDETGLIDNFIFGVRKYFTDETTGVEATAAYAEYRNLARHALFGSVLPAQEIKSFVESFGSLGQQLGPILAHLKSSMEKVKGDYEIVAAGENEMVMLWRTGMIEGELDNTIRELNNRILDIDIVANNLPQTIVTTPIKPSKYGDTGQLFKSKEESDQLDRELNLIPQETPE